MEKNAPTPTVSLRNMVRSYQQGSREIHVLRDASVDIFAGQVVALVGPSGAGKSTLLHIAGLLEGPDDGEVLLEDQNCALMSEQERTRMRRHKIGFIYQFHQLLSEFTALENVLLPQLILGVGEGDARKRATQLLGDLGLCERLAHRPSELSGGEQQRVAIARAVANRPKLLLADEPTGNLDPETAGRVFAELLTLVRSTGLAAIIATHNLELAAKMDRILVLENGSLVDQSVSG